MTANFITPQSDSEQIKAWIRQATEQDMLGKLEGEHAKAWLDWHTNFTSESMFHYAGRRHYPKVLKKMVAMGHDPGQRDSGTDTALHHALAYFGAVDNEVETIEFLLQCGLAGSEHNDQQYVSIAQLIVERRWQDASRGPSQWLAIAKVYGMIVEEEVSEEMGMTPLEAMARNALDPSKDEHPYEVCLVEMVERGDVSLQQLSWAFQVARDKIEEDNPDAVAMLSDLPRVRALQQRDTLAHNSASTSARPAPRL